MVSLRLCFVQVDVPFELVGKVSGPRAMAKASHIKRGTTRPRHDRAVTMLMSPFCKRRSLSFARANERPLVRKVREQSFSELAVRRCDFYTNK